MLQNEEGVCVVGVEGYIRGRGVQGKEREKSCLEGLRPEAKQCQ